MNALLEFYGNFGEIEIIQKLFDENTDIHDINTIEIMMNIYFDNDYYREILDIYDKYKELISSSSMDLYAVKASIKLNDYSQILNIDGTCIKPQMMRLLLNTILEYGDPLKIDSIWNDVFKHFDNHYLKLIFDTHSLELIYSIDRYKNIINIKIKHIFIKYME